MTSYPNYCEEELDYYENAKKEYPVGCYKGDINGTLDYYNRGAIGNFQIPFKAHIVGRHFIPYIGKEVPYRYGASSLMMIEEGCKGAVWQLRRYKEEYDRILAQVRQRLDLAEKAINCIRETGVCNFTVLEGEMVPERRRPLEHKNLSEQM